MTNIGKKEHTLRITILSVNAVEWAEKKFNEKKQARNKH